jgi:NTE family protein
MSEEKARSGKVQTEKESFTRPLDKQRALIFQGGAALGAYEAGAYKILYSRISENLKRQNRVDENVFDIIAGTSIGAINAAIIVSHVMENKKKHPSWSRLECWEGSAEKLEEFWIDSQTTTGVEANPLFLAGWRSLGVMRKFGESWLDASVQLYSKINPYFDEQLYRQSKEYFDTQASDEAARRYFSIPQLLLRGAQNVFSPLAFGIDNIPSPIALPKMDYKFYSNSALGPNNLWFRYTNEPLKRILKTKYIPSSISTNDKDGDPRLLVIAVDVQQGNTVAFDSYPDMSTKCKICRRDFTAHKNGKPEEAGPNRALVQHVFRDHRGGGKADSLRWSVYGSEKSSKYAIFYDEGLDVEHILASASVPVNYSYTVMDSIQFKYNTEEVSTKDEKDELYEITRSPIKRYFWDGQYINNTPLREVINEHQRYWIDSIGPENLEREIFKIIAAGEKKSHYKDILKVPDFSEVYIVNLWPSEEEEGVTVSKDRDGQLDRKNDILFHDKTEYDEKVAELVNDYINLARELLIHYVPKDSQTQSNLRLFLEREEGTSKSRSQKKKRTYLELLRGGFVVHKVVRIERKDDQDAISEKWADYSSGTISKLYNQGQKDTINSLNHNDNLKKYPEISRLASSETSTLRD